MLKMIILFTVCSLINVVLNTVKTIVMHKEEKLSSSLVNSICFGFYTIIVVMMSGDMALWLKVLITAITNFVGVWGSMVVMEKLRKDKVWRVDFTVKEQIADSLIYALDDLNLPYSTTEINNGNHKEVKVYCATQKESLLVKGIADKYDVKYFVSESKTL